MNQKMTPAELLTETWWLLQNGMSPEEAAEALGRTLVGIEKAARRHGDVELHRVFDRAIKRLQKFAA